MEVLALGWPRTPFSRGLLLVPVFALAASCLVTTDTAGILSRLRLWEISPQVTVFQDTRASEMLLLSQNTMEEAAIQQHERKTHTWH